MGCSSSPHYILRPVTSYIFPEFSSSYDTHCMMTIYAHLHTCGRPAGSESTFSTRLSCSGIQIPPNSSSEYLRVLRREIGCGYTADGARSNTPDDWGLRSPYLSRSVRTQDCQTSFSRAPWFAWKGLGPFSKNTHCPRPWQLSSPALA